MYKIFFIFLICSLFSPLVIFAQTAQVILINTSSFIKDVLIPFLFGMAFLVFVYNAVRFFVFEGSNEQGREKAKSLITYSIAAFVFIILFWGIVTMFTSSIGLDKGTQPCTDYQKKMKAAGC